MAEQVECAVIGAGVIGLAVARELARAGREVLIVEALGAFGTVTSARNSEVIHAGIYYPEGSLKGRLCVRGKGMLYDYCAAHGVAFKRCEKLLVATDDDEVARLHAVEKRARALGVHDLEWLDGPAAMAMEPGLFCVAALRSPSTGIVDSHGLMLSLLGEAEERGAVLALNAPVTGGQVEENGIVLHVGGAAPMDLECRLVVNAAGLSAQSVARAIEGIPPATIPPLHLAKGNYFALSGRAPFSRLIYPPPGAASLGTHYTRDLGGQGRFGPDIEWVDAIDYRVDPKRAESFYAAIRRYWPDLPDGALAPAYSGIRPKLQAPNGDARDFEIQGPEVHGVQGLVNLYGIESPGLTSSLAIAEVVAALISGKRDP